MWDLFPEVWNSGLPTPQLQEEGFLQQGMLFPVFSRVTFCCGTGEKSNLASSRWEQPELLKCGIQEGCWNRGKDRAVSHSHDRNLGAISTATVRDLKPQEFHAGEGRRFYSVFPIFLPSPPFLA